MMRKHSTVKGPETYLSLAILAALIAIAVGIFLAQRTYNPAVFRTESGLSPLEQGAASPGTSEKMLLPAPPGLEELSRPEQFEAQTLSDKIDGKAELYLSAGFVGLLTQRFKHPNRPDLWLEIFIYDMGAGQNSFAVYSAQRRDDAQPLDLTTNAYRTQNAIFFVHGKYYLEIIASEASEKMLQPMMQFADAFIGSTPVEFEAIAEKDLFPRKDLIESSISLIPADAFGFERLNQVFSATYQLGDAQAMAFFSHRKTPAQAQELAAAYQVFLTSFGGRNIEIMLPIQGAKMVEILDTYEIIFSCGSYFAGVRDLEDRQMAEDLALALYQKLKEAEGES